MLLLDVVENIYHQAYVDNNIYHEEIEEILSLDF